MTIVPRGTLTPKHHKTLWEKRTAHIDLSTWLNWVHMTIVPRGTLMSKASQSTVGKVNLSGRLKYLVELGSYDNCSTWNTHA